MKTDIIKNLRESALTVSKAGFKPEVAVIAGSGLGIIKDFFKVIKTVPYSKIPHFAKTTVEGHAGEIVLCSYKNKDILLFNGRFHFYEGHSAGETIYPVRLMSALGIKTLIITAAAGALNSGLRPGEIVILKDHINFTGDNPLRGGHCKEFGARFPDMSSVYDAGLRKKALAAAKRYKVRAREGIYFGVRGPSYETPAEVKAFKKLGGDVVGMSVVYEAIAAAQSGMRVLGLAYVSNMAAGLNKRSSTLSHKEVMETGQKTAKDAALLIKEVLEKLK